MRRMHIGLQVDVHGDGPPGSAHYGIEVESRDELEDMRTHIDAADLPRADQDDLVSSERPGALEAATGTPAVPADASG